MRISAVILSLFSAFAPVMMAQYRELPIEAEPISGDVLQADVWDFSQQWIRNDRGRATVCNYGDSLLAETLDGRRFWYSCSGDSVMFCGEEDRLTAINTSEPAFAFAKPLTPGFTNSGVTFTASGTGGGKRFAISETGTIESASSARKGRLILAPGDTIVNVVAVRERHYVAATFPSDSMAVPTQMMTETCRWYDAAGVKTLIPLVIQRTTYYPYVLPDPVALASTAYLPERGDLRAAKNDDDDSENALPDAEAVVAALQNVTVVYYGRAVSVTATMPQAGLVVTADIVDSAGHLYLHESATSSGSADEITLDCTSLRTGEYIAVVSVEDVPAAPKKQLILIH